MGNCVSSNCSYDCIKACAHSTKDFSAEISCKTKLLRAIMVMHTVEQRVLEIGEGAPMTVAELMLEFPGHFVSECEVDITTQITNLSTDHCSTPMLMKRATPLPADHEALPGHIYILFPMHRIHTRLSPHEYASYINLLSFYLNAQFLPRKKTSLHSLMQTSSAKVTPLSSLHLEEIPPHLSASHQPAHTDDAEIDDEMIDSLLQQFCSSQNSLTTAAGNGFSKSGSLVRSKSWIPKLETINESSVLLV